MSEKDKVVPDAEEFENLKKIIEESKKIIEQLQKENAEYKKKNPNKKRKRTSNELMELLQPLHDIYFSDEWSGIKDELRDLYLEDKTVAFTRRAFQLSLLGILWSKILELPRIRNFASTNQALECLQETSLQLDFENSSVWDRFDENDKNEIFEWIDQFRASPNVKPEALMSSNLWGYLLRKILFCIENGCQAGHDQNSKLQFFGEFNTNVVKSLGKTFFTDFVITPGCTGSPLFLAELESGGILNLIQNGSSSTDDHKDLKKLAIQMAGVLLEKIGMIREYNRKASNPNKIRISSLKTFGALIFDCNIEFCTSRVEVSEDGKFAIIFESRPEQWTFNIFNGALQTMSGSTGDEGGSYVIEYSEPIGPVNMECLNAIANFFHSIHDYYSGLNGDLLQMHLNPDNFEKDPCLIYPEDVHKEMHTCSGFTPKLLQAKLHKAALEDSISNTDAYEDIDVPTNYIFPTLPLILFTETSAEDSRSQIIRYLEGMALPEVEKAIESQPAYQMESDRVYYRSILILDVLMGIYKASLSGIGFEEFTLDEITFRNGIYCIKTYSRATHISNDFTVLDSIEAFYVFYRTIYFMDEFMMEGEPQYESLNKIENIVFEGIRESKYTAMNESYWIKLFSDSKAELEKILDERSCYNHEDSTWLLIDSLLASMNVSKESDEVITTRKKSLASLSEPSSSVETMPIGEKNDPITKLAEIAIVETDEEASEDRLTSA